MRNYGNKSLFAHKPVEHFIRIVRKCCIIRKLSENIVRFSVVYTFDIFIVEKILCDINLCSENDIHTVRNVRLEFFKLFRPLGNKIFKADFICIKMRCKTNIRYSLLFKTGEQLQTVLNRFCTVIYTWKNMRVHIEKLHTVHQLKCLTNTVAHFVTANLCETLFIDIGRTVGFKNLCNSCLNCVCRLALIK